MKTEILTDGYGSGTQLYFDGQRVSGVTHISLEIPADGVAELTVTRLLMPTNPSTDRSIYAELEAGGRGRGWRYPRAGIKRVFARTGG